MKKLFFRFAIACMLSGFLLATPNPAIAYGDIVTSSQTVVTVPSLAYDASIKVETKAFVWSYGDENFTWQVAVPSDLLAWDKTFQANIKNYYSCDYAYQQSILYRRADNILREAIDSCRSDVPDYSAWMNEPVNQAYVSFLARDLNLAAKVCQYNRYETADFILSFVGSSIPYKLSDLPMFPAATLVNNSDCEGKSILYASILQQLGYKVCFVVFDPDKANNKEGHVAVGVAFNQDELPQDGNQRSYFSSDDGKTKYYFAETTEKDWHVGQIEKQGDKAHIVEVK